MVKKGCIKAFIICLWFLAVVCYSKTENTEVYSYNDMRLLTGEQGQSIELVHKGLSGTFSFHFKGRGLFDDGGTVIKALNGWWKREFIYDANNPIQLDWYQIKNNSDITQTIQHIAELYAPNLFLKFSSGISRVELDYINLSQFGVTSLALIEPSTPLLVLQRATTKEKNKLLSMDDYRHVYIGGPKLNLTFKGIHGGVRGGHNVKAFKPKADGLFSFRRNRRYFENSFEFRANIHDARIFGIDHRGNHSGTSRTPKIIIAGRFINSGLRLNGGHQQIFFDNVWVSDPFAVALGWDGSTKKENGTKSGVPYSERSRGVTVVYADKVTGAINLEYGRSHWFFSMIKALGNNINEPLVLRYKDLGYTQSGVKVSTRGYLAPGGKVDSLGAGGEHYLSFEELEHDYGYGLKRSAILEATSEDGDGGARYINEGVNIKLNNISRSVITSLVDYIGDYSGGHTVSGSMSECVISHGQEVRQPRLVVHRNDRVTDFIGCVIELRYNTRIGEVAKGNELINVKIRDSGYIRIGAGAQQNHLKNIVFVGESRVVIKVTNEQAAEKTVSVSMEGITAPAGSQIMATHPGLFEFSLDGQMIELPYTFQ